MKNRICAALLTLVLCLPLAGCAGGASSGISVSYPAEPSSGADSGMQAGKAYTVGILFYKSQRGYMHFVWHLFVLAGSVLQYVCIALYCV